MAVVMNEDQVSALSGRFHSVACWVDTPNPDVARAVVREATRWVIPGGDGRLVVAHIDSWLPPLRSRHSVWNLDRPDLFDQLDEYLAELCRGVPGAEPVLLTSLDPPLEAAAWAESEGIDLMVVAAHNSPLPLARLGSFAGPLAALTQMPVLVVPTAPGGPTESAQGELGGPTHVACCVDEAPASEAALELAEALATAAGGRLTLLHGVVHARALRMLGLSRALPSPRSRESPIIERLAERAAQIPGAEFFAVDGRPRDVCAWAEEHDVDLIVAGASRRSTGVRFPGSFASEVVVHATCPVMVVPPRRAGETNAHS